VNQTRAATPVADAPGSPNTWRVVVTLALPVLAQQMLVFLVTQSDRWLAGNLKEVAPDVVGEQVAYQAAQTTAQYLGWFISSYIFLVSVGSTALVAHLTGAGDARRASHAANQSILLATALGAAASLIGLLGRHWIVEALNLEGDAAAHAAAYLMPMFLFLVFQ